MSRVSVIMRERVYRTAGNARARRVGYLLVVVMLGVLCFFPRPWVARAKVLPQDTSSAGLGAILNQLGGNLATFSSFLGNSRPPNDLYLIVARSDTVKSDVIAALRLVGDGRRFSTADDAKRYLEKKVAIRLLLGGVLEIETRTGDAQDSTNITDAYLRAIGQRVGLISREALERKRDIVNKRFSDATLRLRTAEARLDAFKKQNRLAAPETQLSSEIALRANLQAQLAAKLVELRGAEQTAGPENVALGNLRAQVAEIRSQIAAAAQPTTGAAGPNVSGLSALETQYLNLYRDQTFAQQLYEVYTRAIEQVEVENLAAESATFVQVVEPAHIDAERHYNILAVALLAAVAVVALFTELYVPMTGLRWPDLNRKTNADVERA